jgi:hypothetical protein
MLIPSNQLYRVARGNLSLFQDGKIESSPTAAQKTLYHLRATESDTELETRQSRLSNDKLRRSNPNAVADANGFLQQSLRRKVLSEYPKGRSIPGTSSRQNR